MTTFTFKTREEYLAYRADWRARYKELSKEIRSLKNQRKQFKWEYRAKGDNTSQRKTKIGDNPNYDYSAHWRVLSLKAKAFELLEERRESKQW